MPQPATRIAIFMQELIHGKSIHARSLYQSTTDDADDSNDTDSINRFNNSSHKGVSDNFIITIINNNIITINNNLG